PLKYLHYFPTRRSSDLTEGEIRKLGIGNALVSLYDIPACQPFERVGKRLSRLDVVLREAPEDEEARLIIRPLLCDVRPANRYDRSEEHTSELQSPDHLV